MHGIFYDFPIDNALNFTNNQTTRVSLVRRELTRVREMYGMLYYSCAYSGKLGFLVKEGK